MLTKENQHGITRSIALLSKKYPDLPLPDENKEGSALKIAEYFSSIVGLVEPEDKGIVDNLASNFYKLHEWFAERGAE